MELTHEALKHLIAYYGLLNDWYHVCYMDYVRRKLDLE